MMELLLAITLTIVVLVFATAAILTSLKNYRLGSATAKVLSDIRFAQQQAHARNGWYGVRFQASPVNQYDVYSTDGTTDTTITNPANPATTLVINLMSDYEVAISAVNIGGGDKVEFDPMGTPYTDKSGSALAAAGTVTLSIGGTNRVIQILKGTGRAEVQ